MKIKYYSRFETPAGSCVSNRQNLPLGFGQFLFFSFLLKKNL